MHRILLVETSVTGNEGKEESGKNEGVHLRNETWKNPVKNSSTQQSITCSTRGSSAKSAILFSFCKNETLICDRTMVF